MASISLRKIFVQNFALKVIALGIAVSLWVYVQQGRTVPETVDVAVVYEGSAPGKVMVSERVEKVQVTMNGPFSLFNRLDPSVIDPYVIDLTSGHNHEEIFDKDYFLSFVEGSGFEITDIFPRSATLRFEEVISSQVAVEVNFEGVPSRGFEPKAVVEPARVNITGAVSVVRNLKSVLTQPIDVADRSTAFEVTTALRDPPEWVQFDGDVPAITVSVTFREVPVEKLFADIPVLVTRTVLEAVVEPPRVTLTLRGPASVIDALDGSALEVVLDVSSEPLLDPGEYDRPLATANVRGLPEGRGVVVTSFSERSVTVTLTEALTPGEGADAGP